MAHYYDENPTTKSDRKIISYRMNGINFEFVTDTDVFSRNGVDFGSNLMIEEMITDIKESGKFPSSFMDLGCGVGVVGVVMKSVFMKMEVTGADVNSRAVSLANENARINGVKCDFVISDGFDKIEKKFDIVATNPPVRAGKQTIFRFYEEAYEHLNVGGAIYVVLQRKQGAPSTEKKLMEIFGNCVTLGIDAGYRVMKSIKEQ